MAERFDPFRTLSSVGWNVGGDGRILVQGTFTNWGGAAATRQAWHDPDTGWFFPPDPHPAGAVAAMAIYNGFLHAVAGGMTLYRYNAGSNTWTNIAQVFDGILASSMIVHNGILYIGRVETTSVASFLYSWDGVTLAAIANPTAAVIKARALISIPGGDLCVLCGHNPSLQVIGRFYRYNGAVLTEQLNATIVSGVTGTAGQGYTCGVLVGNELICGGDSQDLNMVANVGGLSLRSPVMRIDLSTNTVLNYSPTDGTLRYGLAGKVFAITPNHVAGNFYGKYLIGEILEDGSVNGLHNVAKLNGAGNDYSALASGVRNSGSVSLATVRAMVEDGSDVIVAGQQIDQAPGFTIPKNYATFRSATWQDAHAPSGSGAPSDNITLLYTKDATPLS